MESVFLDLENSQKTLRTFLFHQILLFSKTTSQVFPVGLSTTPTLIPGGNSLFIDGRKLAAGETFFGVLDARTVFLENTRLRKLMRPIHSQKLGHVGQI